MRNTLILAVLFLHGCATAMTQQAMQVRQIQPEIANSQKCKFLGVIEVSGGFIYSSLPEARRDMLNQMRNETSRLGGNAFAIAESVVEKGFSLPFAQADAYSCQ